MNALGSRLSSPTFFLSVFLLLCLSSSSSDAFHATPPSRGRTNIGRNTPQVVVPRWDASSPNDSNNRGAASTSLAAAEQLRQDWIHRSVAYYSKVMREERRKNLGQVLEEDLENPAYQDRYMTLASRHYFALRKIKDGKPRHAEVIYRRIIDNLLLEEDDHECDHANLAITTLLLALHLQRTGASAKQTRSVFLTFFRVVSLADEDKECACSAKVIGAFALFEMKKGNTLKSLQLARRAFQLDPTVMQPLLNWKQFRDAATLKEIQSSRLADAATKKDPNSSSLHP